ncbi:MAG: tRNA preQ1(34) S-adenosylmethionine ribosyltransferase-isomerase QueA [Elusimicrobiales bacterium]
MNLDRFAALGCERLVAASPAEPRDSARLMVLSSGGIAHRFFRDLPQYLKKGDCLVVNDTRVFPARLAGRKPGGGSTEILLVRRCGAPDRWAALCRDARPGMKITFESGAHAEAVERTPEGGWIFLFSVPDALEFARGHGRPPLPHYIAKARKNSGAPPESETDKTRYQTVFAREEGSIAAPTAGFHFTDGLCAGLKAADVVIAPVTLHVGWGTFRPLSGAPEKHKMLPEYASVSQQTADAVNRARAAGGRIIAVGTTSSRTLETFCVDGGLSAGEGWADLFIYPPYKFKLVDGLVTNFHVPGSTPLCMAAALAGEDNLYAAYGEAVRLGYRFYSYGDAMLIL